MHGLDQSGSFAVRKWRELSTWVETLHEHTKYHLLLCPSWARVGMDVAERVQASQAVVQDVVGERAQKMFQDFLEE